MPAESKPYVGPRPFTVEEQDLFYGRASEARELVSLTIAHPVVLLYARSGAGKSSLLNAGMIPQLQQEGARILGPLRVGGELSRGNDEIPNIYVFNAFVALTGSANPPTETIANHLGTDTAIRVLVFDQFEEIFTSYPERWRDRAGFFDDVGRALDHDPRLRVVFAMREELLAELDTYATLLPERLRIRFRLTALRENAALEAVKKPLERTGRRFGAGVAEKLVRALMRVQIGSGDDARVVEGELVEPMHLQVLCHDLWESLSPDVVSIEDVPTESVDEALERHYERSLKKATSGSMTEGFLRRWFEEKLITTHGTRGLVPMERDATAGLANDTVEILEKSYLLRAEPRGGLLWYELSHDRFITPIRHSNERWRTTLRGAEATLDRFESRATGWKAGGRKNELLLTAVELRTWKTWQASPGGQLGASETLRDLVERSEVILARRRMTRQIAGIILGALLLIAVMAALAFVQIRSEKFLTSSSLQRAYGKVATGLAKHEQEFAALGFGIRAVTQAKSEKEVTPEALAGLRSAVRAVGDSLWIPRPTGDVRGVDTSNDGRYVLIRTADAVAIWDAIARSPVAAVANTTDFTVYQVFRLQSARKLAGDNKFVRAVRGNGATLMVSNVNVDCAPDGPYCVRNNDGDSIDIIDTRTGEVRGIPTEDDLLAEDREAMLEPPGDESGEVRGSRSTPRQRQAWYRTVAISPNGLKAVAIYRDRWLNVDQPPQPPVKTEIIDLRTRVRTPVAHEVSGDADGTGVIFSPNGASALVWTDDPKDRVRKVSVWNVADGKSILAMQSFKDTPTLSFTGDEVLVRSDLGFTVIHLANDSRDESRVPPDFKILRTNDRGLVLLQNDSPPRDLALWNPVTGKILARIKNMPSTSVVATDMGGSRIAIIRADGTTRVWDVNKCPSTSAAGEHVCAPDSFEDPSFEQNLATRASLLATACKQLRYFAIDSDVKAVCKN